MNGFQIPHFGLKRQYKDLQDELIEATDLAMRDGILINGPFTLEFEDWLKTYTGCRYASVVHSGTQALEMIAAHHYELSFLAGNEENPVIRIPNLTYPATFNAFYGTGWEVELIDTDSNGLMQLGDDIEYQFNHYHCLIGLYGAQYAEPFYHSNIIVDGAQHWLEATPEQVGEAMAISFDPTKNLPASGNGGAIVTNDASLFEYVNTMKNNGKPDHFHPGTNTKMSELDCAHLLVRARYIGKWQHRRKTIRNYYLKEFEDMPFRCLSRHFKEHADQKFVIYTDRRDELYLHLNDMGIEAKIHYPYALSELPITKDIVVKPDMLSTSIMLSRGVLSLPIYPELTDYEVERIVAVIKNFYD